MRYFKIKEFDCSCCGKNEMNKEFLRRLDRAREYAITPFVISSGYRCQSYNESEAVGGSPTSSHSKGLAADIKVRDSEQRYKIVMGLIGAGFNRIGIGENFIHVDYDETKDSNVFWIY
jgi:uncharacterized protein YcbK (DUF882 family)